MKCLSRSTLGVAIGGINIFGFTITIIYIIVILCDFSKLSEKGKYLSVHSLWLSKTNCC